jgi:hypothetical protein
LEYVLGAVIRVAQCAHIPVGCQKSGPGC